MCAHVYFYSTMCLSARSLWAECRLRPKTVIFFTRHPDVHVRIFHLVRMTVTEWLPLPLHSTHHHGVSLYSLYPEVILPKALCVSFFTRT